MAHRAWIVAAGQGLDAGETGAVSAPPTYPYEL